MQAGIDSLSLLRNLIARCSLYCRFQIGSVKMTIFQKWNCAIFFKKKKLQSRFQKNQRSYSAITGIFCSRHEYLWIAHEASRLASAFCFWKSTLVFFSFYSGKTSFLEKSGHLHRPGLKSAIQWAPGNQISQQRKTIDAYLHVKFQRQNSSHKEDIKIFARHPRKILCKKIWSKTSIFQ